MNIIELKDVCYSYPSCVESFKGTSIAKETGSRYNREADIGPSVRLPSLRGVTLSVRKGARVVVLGENGAGKSTLLGTMGGMHCPSRGTAMVLGRDAFHDTTLNQDVARIGSAWGAAVKWPSTVESHISLERDLDRTRYQELLKVLTISPAWRIDRISDGQRRRVQLLLGLLRKKSVILLDECSNDIDAVDRANILQYFQSLEDTTIVYATHILDNMRSWATDVVVLKDGQIVFNSAALSIPGSLHTFAKQWIPERPAPTPLDMKGLLTTTAGQNAVTGTGLDYEYQKEAVFRGASFSVPSGSRVLVVGRNGSGKSTLLRLLGGKHFLKAKSPTPSLTVCGRPSFHDSTLEGDLALAGTWWAEGDPEWDLTVSDMIGPDPTPYQRHLIEVLGVDLSWHVRKISAGQRKRCQLLLTLQRPRRVLLLDEATADLDVVQRQRLLDFLGEYSDTAGATVLYCTHIYEDMLDWPQYVMAVSTSGKSISLQPWPQGGTGEYLHDLLRKD